MITTTRPRPVRVTLAHECELVSRGLAEMLAPYDDRVRFVPPEPDGTPARQVDITLHDSLAGLQLASDAPDPLGIPHTGRLVTYTWNPRPDLVKLALRGGASGCLSKGLPARDLVAALEAIHRGEALVAEHGGRRRRNRLTQEPTLTPREAEIVTLITSGLDNFQVARATSLSINSVKTHIRAAYRKMGVNSRSQAVLWGVRNGYLTAPVPVEEPEPALTG